MFSQRIVCTDHYMSAPIRGLDVHYSEFTGSEVEKVPIVRIYGSTPAGQKTCMHVHGIFPYIYVPYDGTAPWDRYLRQFATSLDKAINVSLGYGQAKIRHVYKVVMVTGSGMYGYHEKEQEYLKIYFYNPNVIRKSADLLLGGAVLNKQFQPHEAHIPYVLQVLIDYNLYGMNLINVAAVKFRQKLGGDAADVQVRSSQDSLKGYSSDTKCDTSFTSLLNRSGSTTPSQRLWDNDNIPSELYLDCNVERLSTCQLEVDVVAADILNRHQVIANIGANPGLTALWEDEKQRRMDRGESADLAPPESPARHNIEMPHSENQLKERLQQILLDLSPYMDSQTDTESTDSPSLSLAQASTLDLHCSQNELNRTQDITMSDAEDLDAEPVVNINSIYHIVSANQSFCDVKLNYGNVSSQDKSLVDILAGMIDESVPPSIQQAATAAVTLDAADVTLVAGDRMLMCDQDSILSQTLTQPDKDLEADEDRESQEMSQHIWDREDERQESVTMYDLAGMDSTWLDSQLDGDRAAATCGSDVEADGDQDAAIDTIAQYDGNGDEKEEINPIIAKQLDMRRPINPRSPRSAINDNTSGMPQFGSSAGTLPTDQSLHQQPNQHCLNIIPQSEGSSYSKAVDWNQHKMSSNKQRLESDMPETQAGVVSYLQNQKFIHPPCCLQQSIPTGSMLLSTPTGSMQETTSTGSMLQSTPTGSMLQTTPTGSMTQSPAIKNSYGFHDNQSNMMPSYNGAGHQRTHEQLNMQRYPESNLSLNLSHCRRRNNSVSYPSPRSQGQISPLSQNQHGAMSYSGSNDHNITHQNQQPISPLTVSQSLQQAQFLANPYSQIPPMSEQMILPSQTTGISGQHIDGSCSQVGSYVVKQPCIKSPSSTVTSHGSEYLKKNSSTFNPHCHASTSVTAHSKTASSQQHINLSSSQTVQHDVAITSSYNHESSNLHERFHDLLNSPNSSTQNYLIKQPEFSTSISSNQLPDNTVLNCHSSTHPNYCDGAQNYHNISLLSHQNKEFHRMETTSDIKSQTTSTEGQCMQMQQEKLSKLASPSMRTDFSQIDTLNNLSAKLQGTLPTSQLISTCQTSKSTETSLGPVSKHFTRKLSVYDQITPPLTPTGTQNNVSESIPSPGNVLSDKQVSPLHKLLHESSTPVQCERPSSLSKNSLSSLSSFGSESVSHRPQNTSASCEMSKDERLLKTEDDVVDSSGFQTRCLSVLAEQQWNLNEHQKDKQDSFDNQSMHHCSFSTNDSSQDLFAESLLDSHHVDNFDKSMDNSNDNSSSLLSHFSDECNASKVSGGDSNMSGNAACRNGPSFNRQQRDTNNAFSLSHLENFVGSVRKESERETVSNKNLAPEIQPQAQIFTSQHQQHVQNQSHPSHLYPQQQQSMQWHLEWNNIACQQPRNDVHSMNPAKNYIEKSKETPKKRGRPSVKKSQSVLSGPAVAAISLQKKKRGRPRKNQQMQQTAKELNYTVTMGLPQNSSNFSNSSSLYPTQQLFYPSQGSFQQLLAEDNSNIMAEFSCDLDQFSCDLDQVQNDFPQQYDTRANANTLMQQTYSTQFHHNTPHNISQAMLSWPPPQLHRHQRFHHGISSTAQPSSEFHLLQAMQISEPLSNFDTVNPESLLPANQSSEPLNCPLSDEDFEVDMSVSAQQTNDNVEHGHLANTLKPPRTKCTFNDSSVLELIRYRQKLPKLSPAYTYRFKVPTPVFKRLKFPIKNSFDTKAHALNVVRMHPKDARKYSLLKVGKEIIHLENLSYSKIKNIQDKIKAGFHENSAAPSVIQVCPSVCVSETSAERISSGVHLFTDSESNGDVIETSQMVGTQLNMSLPLKSTVNKVPPTKYEGQNMDSVINKQRKNGISKEKKANSLFKGRNIANIPHLKKFRAGFPYFGKGYVDRGNNGKMKQNHPKIGPESDDDGKIVIKDVNLTDASDGILTPIRGRTPVAGHSPAHVGGILPDVESQSQIPVLLETKLKDLDYYLDLNQSGNSHMFQEELLSNKEIEKLCSEEDCEMKERDIDFDLENGSKQKCYHKGSAEKVNEFENYVEKMAGVDSSVCDMKQKQCVTHFEYLLQKDLLKSVKIDKMKELESSDLIERNFLNCDGQNHLKKHIHQKVAINCLDLLNNATPNVEINQTNKAQNKTVEYIGGSDYMVTNKSSTQINSAPTSGDEYVVDKNTNVAKRQQNLEKQNSDPYIKSGKLQKRQSGSLSCSIPGSRKPQRSSSFDMDNRKKSLKAKRKHKGSYRYNSDSDGIPGVDYIVINKFKGQRELRVVVDRLVVNERQLNIQMLEQSDEEKNGIKRRNYTECEMKRTLPNSASLNIEPPQIMRGFSADFKKFLASKALKDQKSDSEDWDISETLNSEGRQRNGTRANMSEDFNKSPVYMESNVQNPACDTTCDYSASQSRDENHTRGIDMVANTKQDGAVAENEYPQQPGLKDFCSASNEEVLEVTTRVGPKSSNNKIAKSEVKKKRTNTIHDGRAFCSKRPKRRCLRPNSEPTKLMCTLSVLHDATMKKLTNFHTFINASLSNQSSMKSSKETSEGDSPFQWQPRIKTPDFELYANKTDDHMSEFKDAMYKLAFLSPTSSDASNNSPPRPFSPKEMNKFEAPVEQQCDKFAEHREQKMTFADILKSIEKKCTEKVQKANSEFCMGKFGDSSCAEVKGSIINSNISDRQGTPCKIVIAHAASQTLKDIKPFCHSEMEKDAVHVMEKVDVIQSDFTSPDLGPPVSQPGLVTIDNGSRPTKVTPNSDFDSETEISKADHCASSRGGTFGSMPPLLTLCMSPRVPVSPKVFSPRNLPESNSVTEHCSDSSVPSDFESKVQPGKSQGDSSLTGSINVIHSEEFIDISDGEESSHTTDYLKKDHRKEWVNSNDKKVQNGSFSGQNSLNFKHKPNNTYSAEYERKLNEIKAFEESLQKSDDKISLDFLSNSWTRNKMQTGCQPSQTVLHSNKDHAVSRYSCDKICFQPVSNVPQDNIEWDPGMNKTLEKKTLQQMTLENKTLEQKTLEHSITYCCQCANGEHIHDCSKNDAVLKSLKCNSRFQEFPDQRDCISYVPNLACSSQTVSQNSKVCQNVFDNYCVRSQQYVQKNTATTGVNNALFVTHSDFNCPLVRSISDNSGFVCNSNKLEYTIAPNSKLSSNIIQTVHLYECNKEKRNIDNVPCNNFGGDKEMRKGDSSKSGQGQEHIVLADGFQDNFGLSSSPSQQGSHEGLGQNTGDVPRVNMIGNSVGWTGCQVITPLIVPPSRESILDSAANHFLTAFQPNNAFYSNFRDATEKPREGGGHLIKVPSMQIKDLKEFDSALSSSFLTSNSLSAIIGLRNWRAILCANDTLFSSQADAGHFIEKLYNEPALRYVLTGDQSTVITPCLLPPSKVVMEKWNEQRKLYKEFTSTNKVLQKDSKEEKEESQEICRATVTGCNETDIKQTDENKTKSKDSGIVMNKNIVSDCNDIKTKSKNSGIVKDKNILKDIDDLRLNLFTGKRELVRVDQKESNTADDRGNYLSVGQCDMIDAVNRDNSVLKDGSKSDTEIITKYTAVRDAAKIAVDKQNDNINCIVKETVEEGNHEFDHVHSTPVLQRALTELFEPECTPIAASQQMDKQEKKSTGLDKRKRVRQLRRLSSNTESQLRRAIFTSQTKNHLDTPAWEHSLISQITGPSLKNSFGFKHSQQNLQDAKSLHEYQYLTVLSVEIHADTRGDLRPDPEFDGIQTIFYSVYNDMPTSSRTTYETGAFIVDPSYQSGLKVASSGSSEKTLLQMSGIDGLIVFYVKDEGELLKDFIDFIQRLDPDILVGYEIQMSSWGYILQRAATLNVNLTQAISRIPSAKIFSHHIKEQDEYGSDYMSEIHIAGRIVLNLWRLVKHQVTLNIYSFENVALHVLHKRIPLYNFRSLTVWFKHRTHFHRWKVVQHYVTRVKANLEIINQLDIIGQTSEFARVFGIEFYNVLSRGSQYRVESMMLRIAKPMNYLAVSPSVHQRTKMRAPECIPLTLEPESKFYTDPVVVLDFQSLYPSIMIAYNYCFSTCLGRLESLQKAHEGPIEFGCTSLNVAPAVIKKLSNDVTISPNGVVFCTQSVKRGVLPIMVEEILNTRLMVKKAMSVYKGDKTLSRMLDARQLGLKLIANVTYGYTGANFSGRMPCIEVGDSIVRKARETLERSIQLVHDTPKWDARVVYGDTDSMFIVLKGRSKDEAFRIGQDIAKTVTTMFPKPIKLKFEKVYLPCVLQTKKRYVGFKYESPDQKEPVYDAKGIETVRRDTCLVVSKILERSIKLLFSSRDISQVKSYVMKQCQKVMEERISIQDFIFAKEYRGMSGYKPGACVPSLVISKKRIRLDRRSEPCVGERVPYVIAYGSPGLPLIQLVREPMEVVLDPSLRINSTYYITKQILPPLNRYLSLIGVDAFSWYHEMPHSAGKVSSVSTGGLVHGKQDVISRYFATNSCPICESQTKQPVCQECLKDPQLVCVALNSKILTMEKIYQHLLKICGTCTGCTDEDSIRSCVSLDCPVLYRRSKAVSNINKIQTFRDVL